MARIMPFALLLTVPLVLLGAAPAPPPPRVLAGVQPGQWEISRSASGEAAQRLCVREVVELAGVEFRGEQCLRSVLGERGGSLVVELSCPRGDFARSTMQVTTPRSLRLETQGIHRGQPFAYRFYARRIGNCSSLSSAR